MKKKLQLFCYSLLTGILFFLFSCTPKLDIPKPTAGEANFSKTIAINVPITSVSPTENSEFLIYPNPTNIEKVQFKDKILIEGFRIITSDGKMVMSKNEKAEIQHIDLAELPVGGYLLQILNKGLWYSQKVMIVF